MADNHDLLVLRDAVVNGRITLGEYATRAAGIEAIDPDTLPVHAEEPEAKRTFASMFGSTHHRIRGLLARKTSVAALFGAARLDLGDARIDGDEVVIAARAMFGAVKIYVPEGVAVEASGLPLFGTCKDLATPLEEALPGSPVIKIECTALFGTVKILPA